MQRLVLSLAFTVEGRTVGAWDKGEGKGAVVVNESIWTDETGEKVATLTMSGFYRGDGGFGGPTQGQPEPQSTNDVVEDRPPPDYAAKTTDGFSGTNWSS